MPFGWSFEAGALLDLPIDKPHPLQRSIMPVVLKRDGRWEVAGTAFVVGREVLLTAAHTIVEDGQCRGEEAYVLYVEGQYDDGNYIGGLLPIDRVNTNGFCDLAMLQVRLPLVGGVTPLNLPLLPMSFAPPAVGDPCAAIGYTAGMTFDGADDWLKLQLSPKMHATRGLVQELHHEGRDRSMLPFPVFRTSAEIKSQMSGSPILAGAGPEMRVTGVVATAYDVDPPDQPISYGSLLWPAAGLRLPFLQGSELVDTSLLELAEHGYVQVAAADRVSVDKTNPEAWVVSVRT
jgi:hypothetical protein